MKPLVCVKELLNLKEQAQKNLAEQGKKTQVKVHLGTCGISSGANKVLEAFQHEVEARKLTNVVVLRAACIGLCGREPVATVIHPKNGKVIYSDLSEDKIPRIVEQHLIGEKAVEEWTVDSNDPLLKLQEIRIMHNQDLDPMNIDEYISRGGYQALAKVLTEMKPEDVIEEIKKSGLRGRGGAGFPTAIKWGFVRSATGDEKYVVCNGDEGDPGAYMNRAVLEGNPHSIIEGMAIGAYAIGNVRQGYAYVRAEYPLAIETLSHAIAKAREYGLLGENILGTGFNFSIDIFPGAGAFVCGEETALLISIEGKRGNPRQRPPFPANKGLFNKPTTLNNVETWSNIPQIILNGADWFASVGNEKCKGTKTLCLVGNVNNTGLVEIPLGTSLGQIVFDIGGGIPEGKKFKAVQIGGPSGGVIPIEYLNTPVDYEAVTALGAIMGSGGLVVMDEDSCMVDVAKFFLQFTRDESCGKCTPCRTGIPQMLEILTKISEGKGTIEDLSILEELTEMIASASICGLGQTAPNPVLTTLRHFREEYEAHIIDKKCPAAVCQALFKSPCQHTCPAGLDIPGYIAFIKEGNFEQAYRLIMQRLPFPLTLGRVCHHPCESKCRRAQVDDPVAIRHLKRSAADYALEHGIEYIPEVKDKKAERIAIIGAGPAGLSAAWDLAQEGYQVTVFETLPVAGGMLAVGIPEYRLPKDILKKEIEAVKKLGVDIKLNTRVDDIESLLKDGYQAVFIATGAHKGEKMGIPGEDLKEVYEATDFLREANLGKEVKVGRKVAVIGGGNSAVDAARVALRKGAKEVHILYRREKRDMPAIAEEITAAEEEDIQLHCLTAPIKILGNDGKVSGLECIRMELKEFDRSGRKTPSPVEGSEYTIDVNTVIEAIGQRPDTSFLKGDGIGVAKRGTIVADPRTLVTNRKGVFTGGDAFTGPATVIEAVAAGQRAASSIKRCLRGEELSPLVERNGYKPITIPSVPPTEEETQERSRVTIAEIPTADKKASFKETVLPYSQKEAMEEASRCLRCDLEVGE
ncbi:MAG: FAD-dependent oxidoreductase [Dehalococcoidia bacterium]|nr:MAG: FAD-dependent oxidoreductase [Dehalococcoidia bacterium]